MSSQGPTYDPPWNVSKSIDLGRCQPREASDGQGDSSKAEPCAEDEINTNIEQDARRFCAYRSHRYGHSREEGLDLLHKISQVQANNLPWYLDDHPVGIMRPGARDGNGRSHEGPQHFRPNASAISDQPISPKAAIPAHSTNMSTQAFAAHRVHALVEAGRTAERAPASISAEVAAGRSPLTYFRFTFKLMRTKPWRRSTWASPNPEETATSLATTSGTPEPSGRDNPAQQPRQTAIADGRSSPAPRATKVHRETKASRLHAKVLRARSPKPELRGGGIDSPPRSSQRRNITQSTIGVQGSNIQGMNTRQPSGSGVACTVAGSLEDSNIEPSFSLPDDNQELRSPYPAQSESPEMVSSRPEPVARGLGDANARNDVTVGWELEFLVPLAKEGGVPSEALADGRFFIPEEMQSGFTLTEGLPAREYLADILRKAGIPTLATEFHDPVEAAIAASYLPDPAALDVSDPYAAWKIVPEIDAMTIHSSLAFDYVGLEFNSRRLPANDEGFNEIYEVLRLTRDSLLVSVTERCGVHVHIGASALDLNEQRHFLCLYLIAERAIFSLCHPRRQKCSWCRPVNVASELAKGADSIIAQGGQHWDAGESHYATSLPEKMRLMHKMIHGLSLEQLQKAVLSKGSRNALALKDVGQGEYTFEFRHFQGSLEPAEIYNWTQVCIALVKAARGLGDYRQHPASQVYDVFYQVCCRPEDQAWRGLLRVLGLADAIYFWDIQLVNYPSPRYGASDLGPDPELESKLSPDLHLPRIVSI